MGSSVGVINQEQGELWTAYHGDCCEVVRGIPDSSVHFSVFSPPFSSLYVYSASDRDMGNSGSYVEFFQHFEFLVADLLRVMMPGRLVSVHCMNLPTSKTHHGYIGIQDFRGDIIRLFERIGFIYHSEVCIWKDPVTAMQRTKALGLLHKQLVKDSCMSRQGVPDYVCTFRKPGVNLEPVAGHLEYFAGEGSSIPDAEQAYQDALSKWHEFKSMSDPEKIAEWVDCGGIHKEPQRESFFGARRSIDIWQRYASPVWSDINPSNTLQYRSARDSEDERHICPLQLDVIERCLQLWSNPNDIVLTPFLGIGSEVYQAVKMGRRGIGIELKESYFKKAVENLRVAEEELRACSLF